MTTPMTRLDERFSEAGTQPTSWEDTLRAIERAQLFWISTVRPDGRPHVTPLVAVWLDGALHFCTGPGEQKHNNIGVHPEVALTTGANDWSSGLDVVLEGTAVRVTDPDLLERLAVKWHEKWDGRWQFEVGDEGFGHQRGGIAHVFAVSPSKVLAFAKQPFTHTRHVF
jgi:uncharacterized pyridoxamine 5'-phosphate oxidase family protein